MAPCTPTEVRPTHVTVSATPGGGLPCVQLGAGLLAPRLVHRTATTTHVALVATTATLLGGDTIELDVEVGPGLRLNLTEVAGTVAYHGRGRPAQVRARLRVGAGATLVWAGEPLVVSSGAAVDRRLVGNVEAGGRLLVRDQVVLGREGEPGGSLRCHTDLRYAGRPALVEYLDLQQGPMREGPGVLGPARVMDTVTAIGWRPDSAGSGLDGVAVYALCEPGAQARTLVAASHESGLPSLWEAWGENKSVRNAG